MFRFCLILPLSAFKAFPTVQLNILYTFFDMVICNEHIPFLM